MPFGASQAFAADLLQSRVATTRATSSRSSRRIGERHLHTSAVMKHDGRAVGGNQNSGPYALLSNILAKTYVLDTRLSLQVFSFLAPSIGITGTWLYMRMRDDEEGTAWMERHFSLSLQNLQEYRLHTLVTSAFGAAGNITGGGLMESCTFLLFGGNLLRSFGFRTVMGIYLAGHVLFSSVFLAMNYIHLRDINMYKEKLANPDLHPNLTYTPRRDKKALVLNIARQVNESNPTQVKEAEKRQREIIRMADDEFLVEAGKFYAQRKVVPIGGGMLLALMGLRLHPLSLIPVPYVPVPIMAFVPVQVWAALAAFDHYQPDEKILAVAPMALSALLLAPFLPKGNLLRHLPIELVEQVKVPKWVPRHIPDTRVDDLQRAAAHATSLAKKIHLPQQAVSKEQLELMRKRNAKFQNKKG
jgi:hypothetical protein